MLGYFNGLLCLNCISVHKKNQMINIPVEHLRGWVSISFFILLYTQGSHWDDYKFHSIGSSQHARNQEQCAETTISFKTAAGTYGNWWSLKAQVFKVSQRKSHLWVIWRFYLIFYKNIELPTKDPFWGGEEKQGLPCHIPRFWNEVRDAA